MLESSVLSHACVCIKQLSGTQSNQEYIDAIPPDPSKRQLPKRSGSHAGTRGSIESNDTHFGAAPLWMYSTRLIRSRLHLMLTAYTLA